MISNAGYFRTVARLEDQMARSTMPRVAALDPVPELVRRPAARTWSNGRVVATVPALTYTLADVLQG